MFGNLFHAASTKADGNMSFKWGIKDGVMKNRRQFLQKYNIALENTVVMKSDSDWTQVLMVDEKDKNIQTTGCGAVITKTKNLYLFLLIADCHPTIVYDPIENILALLHLGRQGVDGLLPEIIINKFVNMGSKIEDVQVIVGPGIKKESYEWTGNLPFSKEKWQRFFEEIGDNKWLIDNIGFIKAQFLSSGVKNIQISDIDTATNLNYFSHVRSFKTGEPEGRFAMIAMMKS